MQPSVPLFRTVHLPEMEDAAVRVLRSGQIASGPFVESFARELSRWLGHPHVVLTSDMSSAMTLALRLAGVGPGDEVLTSPFACMATNAPIANLGARPAWVDVDPATGLLDPHRLHEAITPRSRALIAYHLAGYPADVDAIAAFCRERGLVLIEDCDNALGATIRGRPVGSFGDLAVYSFYPNRQVNGVEGGALACRRADDAARAARLRRFGVDPHGFRDGHGEIRPDSDIPEVGWSASMNNLNSAVALAQLPGLDARLTRTRQVAGALREGLRGIGGVEVVAAHPEGEAAYWTLLTRVRNRAPVLAHLKGNGIAASGLHHRNDTYSGFRSAPATLPGVERWSSVHISLPCGWWMDNAAVDAVVRVMSTAPLST